MPEDHEVKIRYRRDFEERHMENKLRRLIAPGLDGAEDSEQKEAFGRCGATAFGVGCRQCPMPPEALDEWRREPDGLGLPRTQPSVSPANSLVLCASVPRSSCHVCAAEAIVRV